MERNVQRINGYLIQLHNMTPEELNNLVGHTYNRIEAAHRDLDALGRETARRIGETALYDNVIPFPLQDTLFPEMEA